MVICCCSLPLQDCLLLPFVLHRCLFSVTECVRLLSAHMAHRGRVGVPCSFSKHADVVQSGGSCCKEIPPLNAQKPNNRAEFGSEDVRQTHCKWHFYLLAFTSPPPAAFIYWDPQCHFQPPHGNSRPCQQGDNFLMMSPCRGDWRPVARR